MEQVVSLEFAVRSFNRADSAACLKLYQDGLLGGQIAGNDTGFHIDDIELAYMQQAGSQFWVATNASSEVIGMIGVQQHEPGVGEIRRLRVRSDSRKRGIGSNLLGVAVGFCRDNGYLKVALETFIERDFALTIFEKFNFRHERTRQAGEKQLLFFYLDIYGSEKR